MNALDRKINDAVGSRFNKKTMPVIEVFGKRHFVVASFLHMACSNSNTALHSVPKQQLGWTCGYHTMLAEKAILDVLGQGKDITKADVDDDLENWGFEHCYEYEGDGEALKLQKDIGLLAEKLSLLQQKCLPTTTKDEPGSAGKRSRQVVYDRKQGLVENVKAERKRAAKKQKVKDDPIAGKLDGDVEATLSFGPRKSYDRLNGEHAASMAQIKDNQSRRSMFHFVESVTQSSKMMSYGDKKLDTACARTRICGLVFDQVIERPDTKGFDIHRCRASPLRLCLGVSREDALALAKDFVANVDKYQFTDDPLDADELVFGANREPMPQVLKKRRKESRT